MSSQVLNDGSSFSWRDPHAIFVITLVGPDDNQQEQVPFGIQKDILVAKSKYYRDHFAKQGPEQHLENIVYLPFTTPEVFGYAQMFIYEGKIFKEGDKIPRYETLIDTWTLGNKLGIDGLCDASLTAMTEAQRITGVIPSVNVMAQVWKDAPEGSSIRQLMLDWAADYIRQSEDRSIFSKSLPQEVLSELVVAMSHPVDLMQADLATPLGASSQRKNVHYLEADESEEEQERRDKAAKHRHSDVLPARPTPSDRKDAPIRKAARPRASLSGTKSTKNRRTNANVANEQNFTAEQKLNFCGDLLARMLSGPGFWTRLVGPFRQPVNPEEDGVPDYPEKVTRPMDLGTIKNKMDQQVYKDEGEFVADVRQIFANCYAYWSDKDAMYVTCKKFETTFEDKYAQMNKWIAKMEGDEAV